MAAPNYGGYLWREEGAHVAVPEAVPGEATGRELRQKRARERLRRTREARRRRGFVFVVLIPILLMLGSVYLHTVAADVGRKTTELQEGISGTESRLEAMEVRAAELSDSERVRSIAREDLGMKDPEPGDFKSFSGSGVDRNAGGSEQRQGESQ